MEVIAKAKFVRISARKLRMLREFVVGKEVNEAIGILQNISKKGSKILINLLKSALSNASQQTSSGNIWRVKNLIVDEGPKLKRFRASAMGRGVMIRKRMSHLTVILEEIIGVK